MDKRTVSKARRQVAKESLMVCGTAGCDAQAEWLIRGSGKRIKGRRQMDFSKPLHFQCRNCGRVIEISVKSVDLEFIPKQRPMPELFRRA